MISKIYILCNPLVYSINLLKKISETTLNRIDMPHYIGYSLYERTQYLVLKYCLIHKTVKHRGF